MTIRPLHFSGKFSPTLKGSSEPGLRDSVAFFKFTLRHFCYFLALKQGSITNKDENTQAVQSRRPQLYRAANGKCFSSSQIHSPLRKLFDLGVQSWTRSKSPQVSDFESLGLRNASFPLRNAWPKALMDFAYVWITAVD